MQTILGANGTIGSLLAKELKKYTDNIKLVSRNPKKVNETDELFATDLSLEGEVEKAVAGSDIVYLMIGFDYRLKVWQEKWPTIMRDTIDACMKHNVKLVFFDNVYMYDKTAIPNMTEASPINPCSKKGEVRRDIAAMMMDAVNSGKLKGLIARSADFYGPNCATSYLTQVVYNNIKKGKKPNWFMDAGKIHSFTYTPDAARGTAMLGNTEDAYGRVWHLPTSSEKLTGNEIVELFNKEMNADKKVSILPMWMLRLLGLFIRVLKEMPEMMYQYDRDYFFDSSEFNTRFSYTPMSYAEGVKKTVELSE